MVVLAGRIEFAAATDILLSSLLSTFTVRSSAVLDGPSVFTELLFVIFNSTFVFPHTLQVYVVLLIIPFPSAVGSFVTTPLSHVCTCGFAARTNVVNLFVLNEIVLVALSAIADISAIVPSSDTEYTTVSSGYQLSGIGIVMVAVSLSPISGVRSPIAKCVLYAIAWLPLPNVDSTLEAALSAAVPSSFSATKSTPM